MERAQQEAPALATDASVTFVDRRKQSARPPTSTSSTSCGNCGRSGHSSRSTDCPAHGKQCNQCGKDGHFRSVCRSAGSSTGKSSSSSRTERSRQRSLSRSSRPATTNCVDEAHPVVDGIQSVTIGTVHTFEPGTLRWSIVALMASASICF